MTTPGSGSSRPGAKPASEPQAPIPRQPGPGQDGRDGATAGTGSAGSTGSAASTGSAGSTASTASTASTGMPVQEGGPGGPGRPEGPEGPGMAGRTADERLMGSTFERLGSRAWLAVLAVALGTLAVGIMLVVWPAATLTIVAILLGAGLVISGLYRLVEGFTAREASGGMRAAYVVIGLLAILVGLYCLRHRDVSIFLLALLVGTFWIIHGVADIGVAATSGRTHGRAFRLVAGLFSIAAGCIVLFWPGVSLLVLLLVLGIWLIFYGLVLAALAFGMKRALKKPSGARRAAYA